jgi:hypothetical protein
MEGSLMKIPLLRLLPVFIGLAMVLTACDNRESQAPSASDDTQRSGSVAFRLADTVLNVVKQTSDSVRIEAVRDGYVTQVATGAIGGNTLLNGLAPGAWTLKVATYDTLQAVSWYGEAVVLIQSGSTVNAVIVLKRASGSVNVQIVLDTVSTTLDTARWTVQPSTGSLPGYLPILKAWRTDSGIHILTSLYCVGVVVREIPDSGTVLRFGMDLDMEHKCAAGSPAPVEVFVPWKNCGNVTLLDANGKGAVLAAPSCKPTISVVDTVTVNWIEGSPGGYDTLPVEGAWRTDKGIYIATRYDYFVPVVVHNLAQNSLPRRLYLAGTRISTFAAVKLLPHIVFVPFPADEDVIVSDLANDSVFKLPGNRVVAKDSSFVQYTLTMKDAMAGEAETIILTTDGNLVRTTVNTLVDSGPLVQTRVLTLDTLSMIRSILEQTSTRHPGGLPTITAANCPSDAPIHSRVIDYADGTASDMNWSLTNYCGEFPASWTALDPIDALLRGMFAVK